MTADILAVVAVLGAGVTGGVLFAVAVSVVPALAALPPQRYVQTHQLLGRNWDPTMPIIVLTTTAADVALVVIADGAADRLLFAVAAVLMFGTSAVSHLLNVPINREVKKLDPAGPVAPDWRDPRPLWRRWHLLRTTLAGLGFAATTLAAVT
jgi:uncharacterized membrane protein